MRRIMLDFDKELSTFYQLLDEIEAEERRLGTSDAEARQSSLESSPSGPPSDSVDVGDATSIAAIEVASASSLEPGTHLRRADAPTSGSLSSRLSARARRHPVVIAAIAATAILIAGISHGGTLIKEWSAAMSQTEPSNVTMAISTDPGGARVFVDGELIGVSPFEDVQIPAGSRALRIVKHGLAPVDSLIDASDDLVLHLTLDPVHLPASTESVVRLASLTSTEEFSLAATDSVQVDPVDTLRIVVSDTLLSSVASMASRLPTRPVEVVRTALQTRSELSDGFGHQIVRGDSVTNNGTLPAKLNDEFSRLRTLGDERYDSGRYSEAATIYEEASQLRPGNTEIVNSLRLARAAAAIDELPSTVFSPQASNE
ncbi:MAG: PEGA domain-containing protein [Rhodothermia bacterium]|nr:PEGA domain-containing protein [Rhodothermia bacterium]